ncbi:hypothetical protein [Ideonella oryzae]|uniref:Lipoprotein n=1 Tax=Ideonella oryzae TaxID=2937441 RepID=A0ABT1BKG1_9BURK|nr:hypothetical protein [Ideonella oryzae]MCO5976102.1 hypothetical protein [Ideonella oryzae]
MLRWVSLPLVLLVGACASPGWNKLGASPEALVQDRQVCEQAALQALPPKWVKMPAIRNAPHTECSGSGASRQCTNTPGQFVPESQRDDNLQPREVIVDKCLTDKGWSKN